jgi:hypothetical protein
MSAIALTMSPRAGSDGPCAKTSDGQAVPSRHVVLIFASEASANVDGDCPCAIGERCVHVRVDVLLDLAKPSNS